MIDEDYGKAIENRTFEFTKDNIDFYAMMTFNKCNFYLDEGAQPIFMGCLFKNCVFYPPAMPIPGKGMHPGWDAALKNCVLDNSIRPIGFSIESTAVKIGAAHHDKMTLDDARDAGLFGKT